MNEHALWIREEKEEQRVWKERRRRTHLISIGGLDDRVRGHVALGQRGTTKDNRVPATTTHSRTLTLLHR